MAGRVAGKVALVTGAASGIGRATALALAREGARVVATDLAAPDLPSEGAEIVGLAHDVTQEAAWEHVATAVLDRFGALDVLVNNAGINGTGELLSVSLEDWRRVLAINLDGVFLGTQAAIRAMLARPRTNAGAIVNVSSVLGLVGAAGIGAYGASKGAVRLFTKSVAVEAGARGWRVRVNSVHPGYIDTPLLAKGLAQRAQGENSTVEAATAPIVARHPIGRLGRPEDVAAGIVYLASEEAGFVTGAELVIDGGYTAQ